MDSCSNRDYSGMLNKVNSGPYFGPKSGAVVTAIHGDHSAEGELEIRTDTQNPMGMVHGGAIYAMADNATGFAAHTDGRSYVTQTSALQFLRNQSEGTVWARAQVRHRGKSTCLVAVDIIGEKEKLLATGEFTFFCVDKKLMDEKVKKQ